MNNFTHHLVETPFDASKKFDDWKQLFAKAITHRLV